MQTTSYFFSNTNYEESEELKRVYYKSKKWAEENQTITYLLKKPLSSDIYGYDYEDGVILLIPEHNIMFINLNSAMEEEFKLFCTDVLDDVSYLSTRYDYIKRLGRLREWKDKYFVKLSFNEMMDSEFDHMLENNSKTEYNEKRNVDLLISLITENINDIKRIGMEDPSTRLEKIKQNIILFDGDQTKFIHEETGRKVTRIQGLAGTGKTELLLHKLRKLYIEDSDTKIVFTCHNRVLEDTLKKRTPEFFDFMKVDEQIKWEERLWVMRSWGSGRDRNSGVYSYICNHYSIPYKSFTFGTSFNTICKEALQDLENIDVDEFKPCFDYLLIDESQDFGEEFFELCEKVTSKKIYIAGDIFQNVFDMNILQNVKPDYILNKCYRTDSRTLMFAHALGMGLFRDIPLRWLSDEEWNACGYNIYKESGIDKTIYTLSRELVRRFEDVEIENDSVDLLVPSDFSVQGYIDKIVQSIDLIIEEFPDVKPDDIGIIFEQNQKNLTLSKHLAVEVMGKYDWEINFAYDNKEKIENTLFISNNNHVKGLEFPFVICFTTSNLSEDIRKRNMFYMMLTRSFIKSVLILPNDNLEEFEKLKNGLNKINSLRRLTVREPSDKEKEKINEQIINLEAREKTFDDVLESIFKNFDYTERERKILAHAIFKNFENSYLDNEDRIKKFIIDNEDIYLKDDDSESI